MFSAPSQSQSCSILQLEQAQIVVVRIPAGHPLDCRVGTDYQDSQDSLGGMDVMAHLDLRAYQELVSSALDYPNFATDNYRSAHHLYSGII